MARSRQNVEWEIPQREHDVPSVESATLCVLMDIREELRTLNALLGCYNFTQIPAVLRSIRRNTTKRPRAKKKA